MRAIVVIAAGGSGERLGANVPKALVSCAGEPLLAWSLRAALGAPSVVGAVVAAHADALGEFVALAGRLAAETGKPVEVTPGGPSRSHSVREAVRVAAAGVGTAGEFDAYAVHDAARPLVTPDCFEACLAALSEADCAVPATPVTDTVKVADERGYVRSTPDRSTLWTVQTPQAFRREALERALDQDDERLGAATDDAALAQECGASVRLVPWERPNPKVTLPGDVEAVGGLLAADARTRPR